MVTGDPRKAFQALRRLAALLVVVLMLVPVARAQDDGGASANPFRDVPRDHWSVKAIESLVEAGLIEGFPDGTFKGNKVITRYDLAIHVARVLAKLDELRRSGAGVSPEDAVTVSRLTNEYKAELDLLGVKVDRLEKRLLDVEERADRLDRSLSNVRVEGFYRAENVFVDEPVDFTHYPYQVGQNSNRNYTHSGLFNLEQTAYLRFIGQPMIKGEQKRNIETFVELKGVISGLSEDRLTYRFSDDPVAGDNLDDVATGVEDDKRVSVNKAHLTIRSKRMNIRAFANEAITDLKDPAILLDGGAYASSYAPWTEDFSFDQGVELDGTFKKFSYFGSVLKDMELSSTDGNNPADLSELFAPVTETQRDVFAARFTYDMFKRPDGKAKNSLILGTSYVETIWSYDTKDEFNRVVGFDFDYEHSSDRTFELTVNPLFSEGRGDVRDTGLKIDSSYRKGKLLATFKAYQYGYDFQSAVASRPWVDTGINRNFRRFSGVGEHFTRSQVKYDFGESFLRGVEDLTLTGMFETKWFERDPDAPKDTDEITGTRGYVQALADLSDKTHVELKSEHQKDVLKGERGCWTHTASVDVKAWDETSMVGELTFMDDYDRLDEDHAHFAMRQGKFSVNSQVAKWLFLNGYVEYVKNDQQHPRDYSNGRDRNAVGGEFNVGWKDQLTLKGWADRTETVDEDDPTVDGITDTVVAEFGWNFTRALKFRYAHGFKDVDKVRADDEFIINDFAELLYRPTEQTELRLTYGYDYENPDDSWDDGVLEFWRSQKLVRLTAQTDF